MPDKLTLVNAYDDIVRTQVKQLMSREENMCKCEKCFLDICALVFNRGYTNFVTTHKGQVFTQLAESGISNQVDLTITIIDAINKVKSRPNHP